MMAEIADLTELETGEELTFKMDHDTSGKVRELTGTVTDHPYMDTHEDWVVVLEDVHHGGIQYGRHVIIYRDGSVESRPAASRQVHLGELRSVVTPVTDGGVDVQDGDSEFPTTAIPYNGAAGNPKDVPSGKPHGAAADCYQKRMVGNIREGQVLVDLDPVREQSYDRERSHFEAYHGFRWDITNVSDDGRWMTLSHRETGDERRLTVAAFARETIEGERWMFLKDSYAANTWSRDMSSTECLNCGVNKDGGLSREDHFTSVINGTEYAVTARRCVGCGMYGMDARQESGRYHKKFTTGVLSGPEAPWKQD